MIGEKKFSFYDIVVYGIAVIMTILFLLPLLYILANALSNPELVYSGKVGLIPKGFTFENILEVFRTEKLVLGFKNTLLYTVVGTVIQLVIQFCLAYPLTRRDFKGKTFVNLFVAFPMFVSGGMIPTYLVIKELQMLNTIWAIIIPGCIGLYNVIIIRTYISSSVPYELTEAAMIDGCNVLQCLTRIVLPLSKPIICIMTLYGIVGYWNSYFNSLLYTTDEKLWPMQRVLQRMLIADAGSAVGTLETMIRTEGLKYAVILVSSLPLLVLYPFFQKYFEKGVMIGGIKG
ncbi:MAG: carbohydrate ABC transporter permease [Alphaproteobacteria bacterium]|nr:carbohydrate ABC transporter permease [Alphaproteobacteria bacterium]